MFSIKILSPFHLWGTNKSVAGLDSKSYWTEIGPHVVATKIEQLEEIVKRLFINKFSAICTYVIKNVMSYISSGTTCVLPSISTVSAGLTIPL